MSDAHLSTQYLTFQLGGESFAIPIVHVREVLKLPDLTAIPGAPAFIRGVINVRGNVVPVVDLKCKFGQEKTEKARKTRVIIIENQLREKRIVLGALADSVDEVIDLSEAQMEPPPEVGVKLKAEFLRGIGKTDDGFLLLLDVARLFSEEELILTQASSGQAAANAQHAAANGQAAASAQETAASAQAAAPATA